MSDEDEFGPASIYDGDDDSEDDLWFLPPDEEDEPPVADFIFHHKDWASAEGYIANDGKIHIPHELADAVYQFGVLNERVNRLPFLKDFIVRKETHDLLWHTGTRIGEDRLNRVIALSASMVADDTLEVSKAVWAARTYSSTLMPLRDDIRDILGRQRAEKSSSLVHRPLGSDFDDLFEEWEEYIAGGNTLHPFTRAALAYFSWQAIEVSGSDELDAAIVSQKLAVLPKEIFKSTLGFLPLSMGGRDALKRGGSIEERLSRWYRSAAMACSRALLETNRVLDFQKKASSHHKSKSFDAVLDVLVRNPIVSVDMVTNDGKTTKSTAHRYLVELENAGLLKEITHQKRFKFWKIR